jgi:hypothetical protein
MSTCGDYSGWSHRATEWSGGPRAAGSGVGDQAQMFAKTAIAMCRGVVLRLPL